MDSCPSPCITGSQDFTQVDHKRGWMSYEEYRCESRHRQSIQTLVRERSHQPAITRDCQLPRDCFHSHFILLYLDVHARVFCILDNCLIIGSLLQPVQYVLISYWSNNCRSHSIAEQVALNHHHECFYMDASRTGYRTECFHLPEHSVYLYKPELLTLREGRSNRGI